MARRKKPAGWPYPVGMKRRDEITHGVKHPDWQPPKRAGEPLAFPGPITCTGIVTERLFFPNGWNVVRAVRPLPEKYKDIPLDAPRTR